GKDANKTRRMRINRKRCEQNAENANKLEKMRTKRRECE
ncbi:hypothetical protein J2T56_003119, partial [Natronobacillus azotifigens]